MGHVGASMLAPPGPNNGVQLTAYSARCAPAFRRGSGPASAMTSNVKSWQQIFLGFHEFFCPQRIGKAGASKRRRLLLLLSVGWLPPYVPPSGACLNLGPSMP